MAPRISFVQDEIVIATSSDLYFLKWMDVLN